MYKLILFASFFFLNARMYTESIYTYTFKTIEGANKSISSFQGKRILIITLPIVQNSSNESLLHSLDSLKGVFLDSLTIIGVPSFEDGYTPALKNSLKAWYRSILRNQIIISQGVHTRKTSGNQQHPLFKFLTDKDKNGHFDKDIDGPGNKFIVWKNGDLLGVVGAQIHIGGLTMNYLLQ